MIAIYHALPLAHIVAMGAQLSINSFQHKGLNKNICIGLGVVVHEVVEVLVNMLFSRIDRLIYGSSDPKTNDEGFFGDLTFGKFLAKAASSFSLTKIVDLASPIKNIVSWGVPEETAKGAQIVISGLAGVIGTEIPEWIEDYQ